MKPEWYESFFTELAIDFWRAAIPPESTSADVDFLVGELSVLPPSRLLDLPSGAGRHAVALAARGYSVTGVDISPYAVSSAEQEARIHGVSASFMLGDMRDAPPGAPYDGAYCFGNSFGYLSHEDMKRFVGNMFQALRPGGRWVIDTGAAAESLLPHLVGERTGEAGGVTYSVKNRYDASARRLFQTSTLVKGLQKETTEISQAVYTVSEIQGLLERAGWHLLGTYGALDGRPFATGDRRLLLVATRPETHS
jgi:cyclopropane fatty-acyl-phospholipid synthase-like methyltransferase